MQAQDGNNEMQAQDGNKKAGVSMVEEANGATKEARARAKAGKAKEEYQHWI